ncbi:FtsQ-type POTRA domain-containing protein [Candidatus Blochmannia ocreatus (nom. nud.)]|uniref:Cell division protein FtsQ n=1 Tax=Candidatus Blochmannia ocreatus (nom. nud.) TaxID=251538 RepID=A0ABY4SWA3_9ENTR|nr:FtsQ-type POTRA domain-containing protein [Candidatus Blochmannia ocreatus]URJ25225.1 FtsQ-type POTRA domain-containing protein [Candidatus Blochmannia ocreatus]
MEIKYKQNKRILNFKRYVNYRLLITAIISLISIYLCIIKITKFLNNFDYCPITYVIITGQRQYTTNSIINQIITQSGQLGTFITQDVNIIQKNIESLPWIQQVSVRKHWPDTLKINIIEYIPLAYWNNIHIISTTGVLFDLPLDYQNNCLKLMPLLYGTEGSEKTVLNNYLIFNAILKSSKFQIKLIKMDVRFSWTIVLDNNIHLILGRNNIIEQLYFFIKIYPILLNKINTENKYIDYIDLRYHSGFAVKWISNSIKTTIFEK